MGKDFLKRENGGGKYYCDMGKNARIICFLFRTAMIFLWGIVPIRVSRLFVVFWLVELP